MRKGAPIVGRTISSVDFWSSYSVIVIGAELAGKSISPTTLGDLVLGAQDLLVFTAREWPGVCLVLCLRRNSLDDPGHSVCVWWWGSRGAGPAGVH